MMIIEFLCTQRTSHNLKYIKSVIVQILELHFGSLKLFKKINESLSLLFKDLPAFNT